MIRAAALTVQCLAAAMMLLAALTFGLHELGEAEAASFDDAPLSISVEVHLQEPLDHTLPDRPPGKAALAPVYCTLQAVFPSAPAPMAALRPLHARLPTPSPARFHPGVDPAALLRPPRCMAAV